MDSSTTEMIFSGIRLLGGFFDFLVFVGLMVVALMYVKKADGTLGYVLAGANTVRFLSICCTNIARGVYEQMGEAANYVSMGLSLVNVFIELAVWGTVLYVFYALAAKVPAQQQ